MSLATLAVIYGYLMERSTALRVLLALASIPIAVAANQPARGGNRTAGPILGPGQGRRGFFMNSRVGSCLSHRWPCFISASRHTHDLARRRRRVMKPFGMLRFVLAVGLIALTAILLQARGRTEIIPSRTPLSSFPCNWGIGPVQTSRSIKILWTCWEPVTFWCADIKTRTANCPSSIFSWLISQPARRRYHPFPQALFTRSRMVSGRK